MSTLTESMTRKRRLETSSIKWLQGSGWATNAASAPRGPEIALLIVSLPPPPEQLVPAPPTAAAAAPAADSSASYVPLAGAPSTPVRPAANPTNWFSGGAGNGYNCQYQSPGASSSFDVQISCAGASNPITWSGGLKVSAAMGSAAITRLQ